MRRIPVLVSAILLLSMAGVPAFGGWSAMNLGGSFTDHSNANGIDANQQVGSATVGGGRAVLWDRGREGWVDLTPAGITQASAYGICDRHQVGWTQRYGDEYTNGEYRSPSYHAALWSGTAASWVDLHPSSALSSSANGVSSDQQVGGIVPVYRPDVGHAALWTGTAESCVDLNPLGAINSQAEDVSDGEQVGQSMFDSPNVTWHASLWHGTAESWVDLNPAGATGSNAQGVSYGVQAGVATFGNVNHAGIWTGTADSWVDLHPAGALMSQAESVFGCFQVGSTRYAGEEEHACIWNGTSENWVDLHAVLPSDTYSGYSRALDVSTSGDDIWVVGFACNTSLGRREEAMLWHYTTDSVPEPSSLIALCALGTPLVLLRHTRRTARRMMVSRSSHVPACQR